MSDKSSGIRWLALLAAIVGTAALGWLAGRVLPLWRSSPAKVNIPVAQEHELSLADQMAAVKRGTSATIHVASHPLGTQELADVARLDELQVLLLDHFENAIGDDECRALAPLNELVHLRIRGGSIGDAGLATLAALPKLKILNLPQSRVTDRGLEALAAAPQLSQLRLGSPHITDAGLKHLSEFPALRQVHLIDAPITDAGLETLAALPDLKSLYLDGSQITDSGLDQLFRTRPDLHIHINQQHHDRDPKRGHE